VEDNLRKPTFRKEGGRIAQLLMVLLMLGVAPTAFAGEVNAGDTAWMLTATALVLFMTIPGLSLF